jgi:hypothetical protein
MPKVDPKQLDLAEQRGRVKSGLHTLAEGLLPKYMNNFFGRWIIWKIIEQLTNWGYMKKQQRDSLKRPGGWLNYAKSHAPTSSRRPGGFLSLKRGEVLADWEFDTKIEDPSKLKEGDTIYWTMDNWITDSDLKALQASGPGIVKTTPMEWHEPISIWIGDLPEKIEPEIANSGRLFKVRKAANADNLIEEIAEIDEQLAGDFADVVAATKPKSIPWPRKKLYPVGINPQARKVWDEVLDDHRAEIKKWSKKDSKRAWAVAKIIFEKTCQEKKIPPFKRGTGNEQHKINYSVSELLRGSSDEVDDLEKNILNHLKKEKLINQPGKPTYWGANYLKGRYYLAFKRQLKFTANVQQRTVSRELRTKFGFRNVKGGLIKPISATSEMVIEWKPKTKLYVTFYIKPEEAEKLTGESEHRKIIQALSKIGRKWAQTGRLPQDELE